MHVSTEAMSVMISLRMLLPLTDILLVRKGVDTLDGGSLAFRFPCQKDRESRNARENDIDVRRILLARRSCKAQVGESTNSGLDGFVQFL